MKIRNSAAQTLPLGDFIVKGLNTYKGTYTSISQIVSISASAEITLKMFLEELSISQIYLI